MELEDIEKRDRIYAFISEYPEGLQAEEVCKQFFPNHLIGQPQRHVRKILSQDPRFNEFPDGNWRIAQWPYQQDLNLDDVKFCVFDLETTGGVPPLHRVIEIGACKMVGGEVIETYEALVDPQRPIPDYVKKLTGIKNKDLANARDLREVLQEFVKFSEGCVLVAHNASFDVNFINSECTRTLGKPIDAPNLCTLKMSKFLVRECSSHKLEAMAEFFKVDLGPRHRALGDATMTAQILVHLISRAKINLETEVLQDLRKFGVHAPLNFFPPCLVDPESLRELRSEPGTVKFFSETGKCLQSISMLNIYDEMSSIFYEGVQRTPVMKRLLKKSRSFEVTYEDSFLSAQINASRQASGRPKDRDRRTDTDSNIYLKILDKYPQEIYLTKRRLRDEASYLGPFDSIQQASDLLGSDFERRKVAFQSFPVNSGIEEGYELKSGNTNTLLKRNLRYYVNQVNLIIAIPTLANQSEHLIYFVREGYLLKKRIVSREKMDEQSIENVLREVFKSYYIERDLYDILGKPSRQKSIESEIILRWWSRYSEKDLRCRVVHLNPKELHKFREATVRKISRGLFFVNTEENNSKK
ncbi:MAG: 3'-5' exonuclease [bacterium]|nr:3'-5' exonuclease [bacterium]